jgi:hypothetical protein
MYAQNSVTITHENIQGFNKQFDVSNDSKVQFVTEFGTSKYTVDEINLNYKWKKTKKELMTNYDELWRKLAEI